MDYSKFSDEILSKKINGSIKNVKKLCEELGVSFSEETGFTNDMTMSEELTLLCDAGTLAINMNKETPDSREKMELTCRTYDNLSKDLKGYKTRLDKQVAAEKARLEEEEKAKEKAEREAKKKEIADNSIHEPERLNRLKYRFFNHATFSSDDPDGNESAHSPPFFDTIREQFTHEVKSNDYRLFYASYQLSAEDYQELMAKEEYMKRNFNTCLAGNVESDYPHYFFTCFRCFMYKNGGVEYYSRWISNYKGNIKDLFPEFNFIDVDRSNEVDLNSFIHDFISSKGYEPYEIDGLEKTNKISEIYAR